jgi:hypothetical protein
VQSWERYALVRDTEPPSVSVGSPSKKESFHNAKVEFSASVKDATSGISTSGVTLKLDNRKVPVEYDIVRAKLIYRPWKTLVPGKHSYDLDIADRAGNHTHKTIDFTVHP